MLKKMRKLLKINMELPHSFRLDLIQFAAVEGAIRQSTVLERSHTQWTTKWMIMASIKIFWTLKSIWETWRLNILSSNLKSSLIHSTVENLFWHGLQQIQQATQWITLSQISELITISLPLKSSSQKLLLLSKLPGLLNGTTKRKHLPICQLSPTISWRYSSTVRWDPRENHSLPGKLRSLQLTRWTTLFLHSAVIQILKTPLLTPKTWIYLLKKEMRITRRYSHTKLPNSRLIHTSNSPQFKTLTQASQNSAIDLYILIIHNLCKFHI